MPRPNKPRSISAERNLAARIATEREKRGWNYEVLADHMARVGCAMHPSALYKIEKGTPARRITVDELVGFSKVFDNFDLNQMVALEPDLVRASDLVQLLALAWSLMDDALEEAEKARVKGVEVAEDLFNHIRDHDIDPESVLVELRRMVGQLFFAGLLADQAGTPKPAVQRLIDRLEALKGGEPS
ncbi:helix-turn-helix domain-containing protein [Nakamurella leprariae]|uniref:Helix-turn-helix transcriptional regulator n=1 Tax=Nakamurella leprariae TaxID=2803911 RepID=A0A938YE43_9ACTN|nr:helix-turn-helix transcriptional regulator [Nakamurella leprariae]MBM9466083.1 helix-turn-helix transcriptional regulator [Nakamurella leprariae]